MYSDSDFCTREQTDCVNREKNIRKFLQVYTTEEITIQKEGLKSNVYFFRFFLPYRPLVM